MKRSTPIALSLVLAIACPTSAQKGSNTSCDQLRARVPDVGHLLKMTKAERDDLKQFVIANENDLKTCFGDKIEQLKKILK